MTISSSQIYGILPGAVALSDFRNPLEVFIAEFYFLEIGDDTILLDALGNN